MPPSGPLCDASTPASTTASALFTLGRLSGGPPGRPNRQAGGLTQSSSSPSLLPCLLLLLPPLLLLSLLLLLPLLENRFL